MILAPYINIALSAVFATAAVAGIVALLVFVVRHAPGKESH